MAKSQRSYDHEFRVQAVKLAKEIGATKAAKELGIPANTLHGWIRSVRMGKLDVGEGTHKPQEALTLNQELHPASQAKQRARKGN